MNSDGNDNEPLTSPVSTMDDGVGESSLNNTVDDGPGSTCDDVMQVTGGVGSVSSRRLMHPFSNPDGLWNLAGNGLELPDDVTDPDDGRAREADGTFCWDPQETRVPVLESTVWPFGSALLATSVSRPELVAGFEILSELGHGGMGIVYKARHLRLKRLVALKVIRYDRHSNPEDLARFQIEAEVVARLNHPNIVRIYEIGKAGGVPFVALELLEGGTLKDRLAGTPQPLRETAQILSTLARAVYAAHGAGVLHRDIKPSNVLFDRDGIPKIADFGLAKRMDVEEGETITGQVMGTPSYMAPEQAQGWAREIGHAADIYSLGAILYEMMTGRPPIKGETQAETLQLVLEEDPVTPSHLRPKLSFDLETICLKCIARDPQKRYATALDLAQDLDRFLEGEPVLARRTPIWERAIKRAQRRPVITAVLVMSFIAIGIGTGWFQYTQKRANEWVSRELRAGEQSFLVAHTAVARGQWDDARRTISGLVSRIEKETDERFSGLRIRAKSLDEEARRGRLADDEAKRARDRLGEFQKHLDEARFFDTRFDELDPASARDASCREARAGLGLFGSVATGDVWTLKALPEKLSDREKEEVKKGFYELLLILADAIAQSPGAPPAERAEQALGIVDRASSVRSSPTRAYHLRRSIYLEMKADRDGAARERDQANAVAPADALVFFLIGRDLAGKGNRETAIASLEAATHKQPDHFWAQCLLAISRIQNQQSSEALVGLNACVHQRPECAWLYLLRGIANANEGTRAHAAAERYAERAAPLPATASEKFDAAEEDYRKALELVGDSPTSGDLRYVMLQNRGYIRIERGNFPGAAVDLQAAIRQNDRRYEAFVGLAHVYRLQGKTDLALEQIARAIRIQPARPELHRARADLLLGLAGYPADLRGVVLLDLEDDLRDLSAQRRSDAHHELELAIRCEPPRKAGVALDKIRQAVLLHVSNRGREALNACDTALAVLPGLALAHQLRIRVLLDLKQYDNLLHSCDLALDSVARSAELYELRGMVKDRLGDYVGARDDYTLSLSLKTGNACVLRRRGWSFLAQDALKPAESDFDRAISLAPKDADALSGRALVRVQFGHHEAAMSDAEDSLSLARKNWRLAYNAARVYAISAIALDSAARKTGTPADRAVKRYLDRAFDHVCTALDLAPPEQHSTILADPALKPIRDWLKSRENLNVGRR